MRIKKQHKIKRSNTICRMGIEKRLRDLRLQYLRLQDLKDITDIQCSNGNWNYDPYMHGMANGMVLSLSTMLGKDPEPDFKKAPEKWLSAIKKALCRGENK